MRMTKLAFLNFKSSTRSFLSLILSLAFTIMIFLNLENITYSDALIKLGQQNKVYADIIVQVLCFVLGVFSFFYIWYATNVFLTKRKKEIGIYIFMGLSNEKIGRMYMIESALIGITAMILGLIFGSLTTGLFQMILLAVADIAVDVKFQVTFQSLIITGIVYGMIYSIFVWKGYFNIVRSSVLGMISAARQNEYVGQNSILLFLKAVLGCGVLGRGFYMAVGNAKEDTMLEKVLAAVILVTAGVYLLFGGLLPFLFRQLAKNKNFLYRKQRNLWINQVIFRMKKNYRTYAMVCVLMLSAVTALAAGFATKNRYDNMMHFEKFYTFQFLTNLDNLDKQAEAIISENSTISCQTKICGVMLKAEEGDSGWGYKAYLMVPYSELKELAAAAGLEFSFQEPAENEVIELGNLPLMSFIGYGENEVKILAGKTYKQTAVTREPYFGYLQKMSGMVSYVVNDETYRNLLPAGQRMYLFNYRISNPEDFARTRDALNGLVNDSNQGENYAGRVAIDPQDNDADWIKVLYGLCVFIFMVFIMAGGCIMLMKVYNDSTEEKERYIVMKKMGLSEHTLRKSIACELGAAYGSSFLIMAVSSYFSINALARTLLTSLTAVNIVSVLIIFVIFAVFYFFSVSAYWRNVECGF